MNRLLMALERRSTRLKLVVGFAGVLAVAFGTGLYSLYNQRVLSADLRALYENELLGVSHLEEARIHFGHMGRALRQAVLAQSSAERDRAMGQLTDAEAGLERELATTDRLILLERDKEQLASFKVQFALYKANIAQVVAHQRAGRLPEAWSAVAPLDLTG